MKRCVMILADGARADVMQRLMTEGRLPHIGESLRFYPAVTAFPSTTGPAYMPFLTGCYPGTCNVPGIRWFDKTQYARAPLSRQKFRSYVGAASLYMGGDMMPGIPSLFDLLRPSINIFSSVHRGVPFWGDKTKFSRIWYWYYAHLTDHWGLVDQAAREKILRCLRDDFRFLFVVLPGIDEFSHLHSPFGDRTLEAYQELDRTVGQIVAILKDERKWGETCLMIVSDHGLSETRGHLGLNRFLEEEMGISTFYYPKTVFKFRFDAASMVSGNAMAHLYFRNQNGGGRPRRSDWQGRTPWEALEGRSDRLLDRLLEKEEVDLVAGEARDGSVVVKSQRGEGRIAYGFPIVANPPSPPFAKGGNGGISVRYEIINSDPFGYPPLPEIMTDREALENTFDSNYPDALMQLLQVFRSRRAGDLVVSAKRGFDLRYRHEIHEHKSSHGSLEREQMMIPFVTNIDLPQRPVRSVDVFPTVLQLLGEPIPAHIDGVSLLNPP